MGGQAEIETILDADGRVLVIVSTRGAGGVSGTPGGMRWGQAHTLRDGRIVAVDNYYSALEALEAVGLSE